MPGYKKKRVNKFRSATKSKGIKRTQAMQFDLSDDISMSPLKSKKTASEQKNMRVVKGKKLEQQRKLKLATYLVTAVVVILTVLNIIFPAGIIESLQTATAVIGSGSYPIKLDSTETLDCVKKGMYYYVLTDREINAFSNNGKEIFSSTHGFENPVLKTSKTRALVFDQGKKELQIYNSSKLKTKLTTESEIITAGISDSGTYAVVTQSEKYASSVSVYNKNDKLIYEWLSSEYTVNNVAISPNGKKIVVSTFNAVSGKYISKINVLTYDSATPVFTETVDNTIVYNIDTTNKGYFSVLTSNGIEFIKWSKYNKTEYNNDYSLAKFKPGYGGSVAVFNRESDRTDNRVAIFNSSGRLKGEFQFNGIISDIQISKGHIYCISDTEIFLLKNNGDVLRSASCGFGAVRILAIGNNSVCVITDNEIEEIKLK